PATTGTEFEGGAVPTGDDGPARPLADPPGARCAVGRPMLPRESPPLPAADDWPSTSPPDDPPMASPETLADARFGSIEATFVAGRAPEYLDGVREDLPLFRDE